MGMVIFDKGKMERKVLARAYKVRVTFSGSGVCERVRASSSQTYSMYTQRLKIRLHARALLN